jgi:hypothetical protein
MVVTVGLEGCDSALLGICKEAQSKPKQQSKPIRNEQQTASAARAAEWACRARPLSAHPAIAAMVQMADVGYSLRSAAVGRVGT